MYCEGMGEFPHGNSARCELAPGEQTSAEFEIALTAGGPVVSRLHLTAAGQGVKPAELKAVVEYPLPALAVQSVDGLADAMRDLPIYAVRNAPLRSTPGYVADVRLAVAGDCLALSGTVHDSDIKVTDPLWAGSCVELFGTSPDRERIGHVFGGIEIGQVYLLPAFDGEPARVMIEKDNAQHPAPQASVRTQLVDGGYAIQALVPLELLAINPESGRFLIEVQVTAAGERAVLFSSEAPFNNTGGYGLAVVQR